MKTDKVLMKNSWQSQLLALCTFSTEGMGSLPSQRTKILQEEWHSIKKKKKKKKIKYW